MEYSHVDYQWSRIQREGCFVLKGTFKGITSPQIIAIDERIKEVIRNRKNYTYESTSENGSLQWTLFLKSIPSDERTKIEEVVDQVLFAPSSKQRPSFQLNAWLNDCSSRNVPVNIPYGRYLDVNDQISSSNSDESFSASPIRGLQKRPHFIHTLHRKLKEIWAVFRRKRGL